MANENTTAEKQVKEKPNKPAKRSKFKELIGEVKKVTWPGFGKVVKQTATVLVVTVVFLVVIFAMDLLLGEGHKQLIGGLGEGNILSQFSVAGFAPFQAIGKAIGSLPLLF